MAPRKRKQTGLTRMDAALDQVSCFGFSRQLIRQTVKNLLKVYGDDGWKLIEEDGYRVVLDFILDEQESAQTKNLPMLDAQQENTGNELVMTESSEVAAKDASSEGNNNASLTIHTAGNDECSKDIAMDKTAHSSTSQNDHSAHKFDTQCSKIVPLSGPSSDATHALVNVPARRRKPCYGWISDDDDVDEETHLITLTPAR